MRKPPGSTFLAAVLLGFLSWGAGSLVFLFGEEKQATLAEFKRIELGMQKAEVGELLGRPASSTLSLGRIISEDFFFEYSNPPAADKHLYRSYLVSHWFPPGYLFTVVFNPEDETVVCRSWVPQPRHSLMERVEAFVSSFLP